MITLDDVKLRSKSGRKSTTGLSMLISRRYRRISPTTKVIAIACTRQDGSLYQSHSWPLLRRTSQQATTKASRPSPM